MCIIAGVMDCIDGLNLQIEITKKMVLVNLCKLLYLIQCIKDCPADVPRRTQKLFEAYYLFIPTSDELVSVEVSADFERAKEAKLDDLTPKMKTT